MEEIHGGKIEIHLIMLGKCQKKAAGVPHP